MATAVVRHAGARHIVVSEPNAYRRDLAMRMGAIGRHRPARARPARRLRRARTWSRASTSRSRCRATPPALRGAIAAMAHGGAIALLGIPTGEIPLDINEVVFKLLTLRGIYGREMYETWYKMTVMLQSGLDIRPAITHRFGFRDFEAAFAAARRATPARSSWTGPHDAARRPLRPARLPRRRARRPCASATCTGRCA